MNYFFKNFSPFGSTKRNSNKGQSGRQNYEMVCIIADLNVPQKLECIKNNNIYTLVVYKS